MAHYFSFQSEGITYPSPTVFENTCTFLYQLISVAQLCPTLRPHGLQRAELPCPSLSPSLLKLMSIESVMPSNHLIFCSPLILLPSVFPSISVFFSESALCIRWPRYWSFSSCISPSNEYSELISFRIDWFDLAVQEILKSLLLSTTVGKHQFFSAQPSFWSMDASILL